MTHTHAPRRASVPAFIVAACAAFLPAGNDAAAQTYFTAADADRTISIAAPRVIPLGVFHQGVVVVGPDVDGDGVPDLLLTTTHHYESTGGVLPGRAAFVSGATGAPLWTAVGAPGGALFGRSAAFVADNNGDGVPDVIVGEPGMGRALMLSGATGAHFETMTPPFSPELSSFGVSIAPFRREPGLPRFVVVGSPGVGRVHFYVLDTSPPQHLVTYPPGGGSPLLGLWAGALGDLNDDGYEDVAAIWPSSTSRVIIYSGENGAILWTAIQPGLSVGQSVAAIGDITGDGAADIIVAASTTAHVHRGADGEPRFQIEFDAPDPLRSVLGLGDVTGDGVPDFAVGSPNYPPELDDSDPDTIKFGRVTLYCGRTLQPVRVYDGPSPHAMMGHSLAAHHNADGDGAVAIVARAFRTGDDESVNGVYAYTFITPPPCLGDTNFDRLINKADFAAVLAQYGQSGPLSGDLNHDGVVDFADVAIVLSRYGAPCD